MWFCGGLECGEGERMGERRVVVRHGRGMEVVREIESGITKTWVLRFQ